MDLGEDWRRGAVPFSGPSPGVQGMGVSGTADVNLDHVVSASFLHRKVAISPFVLNKYWRRGEFFEVIQHSVSP